MKYTSVIPAQFISRPNRFIAHVSVEGKEEIVHVKNTGRCKELLIPGVTVYLEEAQNPQRKTKYDLVAVEKIGFGLINIDSQAPNRVVSEWLQSQNYSLIKPEYTFGQSRIDFYMERDNTKYLMEVKGCTLEIDDIGYFPDAPTQEVSNICENLLKHNSWDMYVVLLLLFKWNIYKKSNQIFPQTRNLPELFMMHKKPESPYYFFVVKLHRNH